MRGSDGWSRSSMTTLMLVVRGVLAQEVVPWLHLPDSSL